MNYKNAVINFLDEKSKTAKKRTLSCYKIMLSCAEKMFEDTELNNFSQEKLNNNFKIFTQNNWSLTTKKYFKNLVNACLRFNFQSGFLQKHIQITTSFAPEKKKGPKTLSLEEVSLLEDYIMFQKNFYHYGILITLYAGLRVGEVLALEWENVDLENHVLTISSTVYDEVVDGKLLHTKTTPKTIFSQRQIPVVPKLEKILKELKCYQKGRSKFVVCSKQFGQVYVRAYQESFSRLQKKLGIKHTGYHSLRHTFATLCHKNQMDTKSLSSILGHSNITTTLNLYVHPDFETKMQALLSVEKNLKKPKKPFLFFG